MNDGTMFELMSSTQLGEVNTPTGVYPTTESTATLLYNAQNQLYQGDSNLTNRLADVDGDGRVDIVKWDAGGTPSVFYNLSGQFLSPANSFPSSTGAGIATRRHISASQLGAGLGVDSLKWELTSDVLDLDGDGIPEALRASSAGGATLVRNLPFGASSPVAPPRLLKQITNNRGLKTFITYASMHEDAPIATRTVTQDPAAFWEPGRPKATPAQLWVTKSIRVEDEFDAFANGTGTTTSYKYANPRHGKDDLGQYGFRGFETVTTTSQSGAKTVETYDYLTDWSGRLVKSVVYSAEAPTSPVTVDTTKYEPFTGLLGGAITIFNATRRDHFVCADNSNETACSTPTGAVYFTRTDSTFDLKASNTAPNIPLMYVESSVRLQHSASSGPKDRVSLSSYFLAADGSTYRLRPTIRESQEQQTNGSMATFAKSETTWDASSPAYARKSSDKVWFDASNVSTTNYNYEASTGNLLSVTSPRGNTTSYEYDSRKLFVAFDNSPYYTHDIEYTYEYGTGVKLETRGPNTAPCAIPQWPTCSTTTYRQTTRVVVDGLGRPVETWGTVDIDPYTYDIRKIGITSYVDTAPASVTTQSALKQDPVTGAISYAAGKTIYDGHGRPTRVEQWANGSLGPSTSDNVTTYAYRLEGTLQTVSIQNPSATTAALVPYTYTFDSLGRPKGVTRPDSGATGASVTYGSALGNGITVGTGVYTDTVEVAETAAKKAELRRTLDADGRLIKVEEKTAQNGGGGASAWATTLYDYDAAGNVSKITDAEGKITTLAHDWAGHRLSIDRGNSRKWEYQYDLAGNVTSEISPHTAACEGDPACKLRFTTAIAYDLLDRASTKNIAPRDLSNADLDLFGAVQELYRYDWGSLTGSNDHGHLNQWHALGLNSTVRSNEIASYDAQGNRLVKWLAFNSAGYDKFRWTANDRYLSGAVKRTHYNEGANGGSVETVADFDYDARGLPSTVKISVDGGSTFGPAITDTRNIAGLVTKRRADYPASPTPPMSFIDSSWTYDVLGRVLTQTVTKGAPASTPVAKQTLTYFGNDDVETLRTDLGAATGQTQTFTFDYRHQLTGVAAGTGFGGTYVYGNAGRFTQATVTSSSGRQNNDIVPRNVFYNYASTDPELVTSLNSNSLTGPAFMTYTYDLAGNQLTKVEASTGNKWDYLYDGSDRLRRATKKTSANVVLGSEEYWYDWGGNRSQVVTRNGSGTITEMVWFQDGVEAHYSPPGANVLVTFAYAHAPMVRVKRTSDTVTNTEYQFHGLASNLLAGVESNGTINVSFNYAPFGEVIEATQSSGMLLAHKRRLNDKQQDDLTGLFYYGARYYDRTLMGWTQIDPLYLRLPDLGKQSTPRRTNLAVFSLNNPTRYLDPDGRDSVTSGPRSGAANVCNQNSSGRCTMEDGAALYESEKSWLAHNTARDKAKQGQDRAAADISAAGGLAGYNRLKSRGTHGVVLNYSFQGSRSSWSDLNGDEDILMEQEAMYLESIGAGEYFEGNGRNLTIYERNTAPTSNPISQGGVVDFGEGGDSGHLEGRLYEIIDGVHRAVAAARLGIQSLEAEVMMKDIVVGRGQIPVSQLRSPNKSYLDMGVPKELYRFQRALDEVSNGKQGPIKVTPGSRGVSPADIKIIKP